METLSACSQNAQSVRGIGGGASVRAAVPQATSGQAMATGTLGSGQASWPCALLHYYINSAAYNGPGTCGSGAPPAGAGECEMQGTSVWCMPTPVASLSASDSLSNGQQIPVWFSATEFGAWGPLYEKLPDHPTIAANSESAMAYYFSGNPEFTVGWIDGNSAQSKYDYNFPVYMASNADPLVTISCAGVPACAVNGAQIHLPSLARQAGGGDGHLAAIQPDGTEYDFWRVSSSPPYTNGSQIRASGGARFTRNGGGNVAPGFAVGGATAGGIALSVAQVYTSELAAGSINHAISLVFPCGTNSWVFPATQATGICAGGKGMALGSQLWWAPNDAQTNALSVARDVKTILIAMHHYGAFFTDNGDGTMNITGQGVGAGMHLESQEPYWIYGNGSDPALTYAQSAAGWNHIVTGSGVDRYLLTGDGPIIDFLDNLKLLAPCVVQLLC